MDKSKTTAAQKSQSQKERFIETAHKLEVDESGETFEKAFGKIAPRKTAAQEPNAT